jgi:hypothetical protein
MVKSLCPRGIWFSFVHIEYIRRPKFRRNFAADKSIIMKELIACCGLDCENCDARRATVLNDDALRKKTAELWAKANNAPIRSEHINCLGCRVEGVKCYYCSDLCQIRQCVLRKGYATCADCPQLDSCITVGAIFSNVPAARENLGETCGH